MLKLPELIKDLAADGCTDVDAIEIATDLMKIEFVRRKLNNKINGNLIDDVIEYTKNANELDTKTFYKLGGLSDKIGRASCGKECRSRRWLCSCVKNRRISDA